MRNAGGGGYGAHLHTYSRIGSDVARPGRARQGRAGQGQSEYVLYVACMCCMSCMVSGLDGIGVDGPKTGEAARTQLGHDNTTK